MRQSNLLVFNTIAVYARMALTIPMGLLLVRFAYGELGEIDFGLWTVLGASTAIMATVTESLTRSGQRHLAFAIGQGDNDQVVSIFQTVQSVFWLVAMYMLLIFPTMMYLLILVAIVDSWYDFRGRLPKSS